MPTTDSPLRYPGGKSQLSPFVIDVLLRNDLLHGTYAEPFAGGCGIAWTLLLNNYVSEVWINDIDPAIYAFWRCVLDHTDALCERIERTPVTMEEWNRQRAIYDSSRPKQLDLAFATLFLNRTNRSGILRAGVIGGKDQQGAYKLDCRFTKPETLRKIRRIAMYRDQVRLTRLDAADFISQRVSKLPTRSLTNIDPPYYSKGPHLYCSYYNHDDHVALAKHIRAIRRPWMLTYDDAPEIRAIYARRPVREVSLLYFAQVKRVGVELLYSSPDLVLPYRSMVA